MQPQTLRAIRAWVRLDAALAAYNRDLRARFGVDGLQLAMLRIIAEYEHRTVDPRAGAAPHGHHGVLDGVPLIELRRSLSLHPATLGQAIDRLVRRGLCDRTLDPHDARARLVRITPAGRALLAAAPLAGPVRLRYVPVDVRQAEQIEVGLASAVDAFGLAPWAPPIHWSGEGASR